MVHVGCNPLIALSIRTVAEIQEKIVEKDRRNLLSRLAHAKNDKEAIVTWRSDLNRVLHVFNVCSLAASIQQLLTATTPQTELAIGTHVVASETHTMVSELHRSTVTARGVTDSQYHLVSVAFNPSIT